MTPPRRRRAHLPPRDGEPASPRDRGELSPFARIVDLERQLRTDVAAQRSRPAWFPGRWSRAAAEQRLRGRFEAVKADLLEEYRCDWLADDLAEGIQRATSAEPSTGGDRDPVWRLPGRPGRVRNHLPDAHLARRFNAVSDQDIEAAVAAVLDERARIAAAAPLVYPPPSITKPLTDPARHTGEIRPAGLDGRPLDAGTCVLRYRVHADEGVIEKIRIDSHWEGLGLATRMVETLLTTYPAVDTWWTTPQSPEGVQLFAHVRSRHPSYGWRHLSERRRDDPTR